MSRLSIRSFVNAYAATGAPGIPPQVQQVANHLSHQACDLLARLIQYRWRWASLSVAFALLVGSLLLIRYARVQEAISPRSRPDQPAQMQLPSQFDRHPKRLLESRIARANRQALQLASTRIKGGQLSN